MYLIRLTNAQVLFEKVDLFMRDLPFLYQSLLSTLFISVVPIFLIYVMNKMFLGGKAFTNVLLSFALGGLLGDVFFHTMPHLNGDDTVMVTEPLHQSQKRVTAIHTVMATHMVTMIITKATQTRVTDTLIILMT